MSTSHPTDQPTPAPVFLAVGVSSDLDIQYVEHDYHRNGISGAGFWVFVLRTREVFKAGRSGKPYGIGEWEEKLAILFDEDEVTHPKAVAVFDFGHLDKREIAFGVNSHRGDRYVDALRFFLKAAEDAP